MKFIKQSDGSIKLGYTLVLGDNILLSETGEGLVLISAIGSGVGGVLNDLSDVTITAPANFHLLQYNASTTQWENKLPAIITVTSGIGIGTSNPLQMLHLKTTGEAAIWLEADTDNAGGEDQNAFIKFSQDGSLVNGIIGFTSTAGLGPDEGEVISARDNSLLINTLDSGTQGGGGVQIGAGNVVRITLRGDNGRLGFRTSTPSAPWHFVDSGKFDGEIWYNTPNVSIKATGGFAGNTHAVRYDGDDTKHFIDFVHDGTGNNRSLLVGGDIEATGGGFRQTIDGWKQDNVAASQTDVELVRWGATPTASGRFRAVRPGSVTGVIVTANEARTAGTLTVTVFKNTGLAEAAGATIGLTAVLDGTNTSRKATTQAKDLDTFLAGDELYITITTTGTWTPTTSDIRLCTRN